MKTWYLQKHLTPKLNPETNIKINTERTKHLYKKRRRTDGTPNKQIKIQRYFRSIAEKFIEYIEPPYMCFVDLTNASECIKLKDVQLIL